jgi:hypothetical protein
MRKLGGFIGAVLALVILLVFTEWLFIDSFSGTTGDAIETAAAIVVGVAGWVVGSRVAERIGVQIRG